LEAQRRAISLQCKRRGWELVETIENRRYSGKELRRPGVQEALRTLEAGEAKALVVAKLDRLSRSMIDFAAVMAKAQKQNWGLVALDVAVDSSTPGGEAMVHMLATFAQFERRLIAQRTREALAVKTQLFLGAAVAPPPSTDTPAVGPRSGRGPRAPKRAPETDSRAHSESEHEPAKSSAGT
jgi:DNA invertase Pin-like site-specific DNA recombinase